MNKKVLCLIPTIFLVTACEQNQVAALHAGNGDAATPVGTKDIVLPDHCQEIELRQCPNSPRGNPPPVVNIQIIYTPGNERIDIVPDTVCAEKGEVLNFKIIGPPAGAGSVAILPKDFVDTWLIGTNLPDANKIEISVPSSAASGDHLFAIVTSTGLCMDPRIHVW